MHESEVPVWETLPTPSAVRVPIPATSSVIGAEIYAQWIISSSSPNCSFGFDLSDALRVRIQ